MLRLGEDLHQTRLQIVETEAVALEEETGLHDAT
jgi:hypothetical protein